MKKVIITENQYRRIFLKELVTPTVDGNVLKDQGVDEKCKTLWETALKEALEFWDMWLEDPITRQKFKKNWGIHSDKKVDKFFDDYRNVLEKVKVHPYAPSVYSPGGCGEKVTSGCKDGSMSDAYGFVRVIESLEKVFVNCEMEASANKKADTVVHEILHLLWDIKPLNPNKKIGRLFGDFQQIQAKLSKRVRTYGKREHKWKKEKREKKWDKIKQYSSKVIDIEFPGGDEARHKKAQELAPIFQTSEDNMNDKLYYWYAAADSDMSFEPLYTCDENENMGRLMAIRYKFNLSGEKELLLSDIKPYILGQKDMKEMTNLKWLLHCWALNGFPDIEEWLSELNNLAAIEQEKETKSV